MNLGKKKAKKEEVKANPFIGRNHIGALLQVIKKSSDPNQQWRDIPEVRNGITSFRHEKIGFDEILGVNKYVIEILNRVINKELKAEDDE